MEKKDDFFIPDEVAEWIGLKKSEYLSKVIELQGEGDIGFELFPQYDSFIPGTIETPDKSFQMQEDGQTLRTYVRSYNEKNGFHQLIRGVLVKDEKNKAAVFVPILILVSINKDLIRHFCEGETMTRPTLN